uniref:Uncharacterized protein n=1 Tax=Cryptococcus bacillisporus CA1280 TaxID=1296109 RepID=A0A0D0VQP1_CRYGA|nr:hypothetical protein I312_03327 [Cryptococcus bacillisporus CA1280]
MTDLRASNLPTTISSYTTGATAQTGGFVQADNSSAPPSNSVFESGGGLASSPNVPKPGTSINPQTGKPHTAGLTRAQLEAQKAGEAAFQGGQTFAGPGLVSSATTSKPGPAVNVAHDPVPDVDPTDATQAGALSTKELEAFKNKGTDLLDPAPQTEQVRRGSISNVAKESKMRRPSDVSGREQAARQLAGLVPDTMETASAGSSTPGQELPGGWGAIKPTPLPGSGPHAPTSLYEDVTEGLGKMGQAAFSVIPSPIKDAFHGPGSPKGRRSSATGLIDHAKAQASKVAEGLQETIQNTQRRASANFGPDGTIRKQVMHFVDEAFQSTKDASSAEFGFIHSGPHGRVAAVPRVSHPTEELVGAQPGEHSDGVGALPGTVNEAGVAILPDERSGTHFSLPSHELIGALNREHSSGVGALPGTVHETGVAILPEEEKVGHVRIHPDHAAGVGPRTSLPSDEYIGALPREHSSGVGALPGTVHETGVAILPEEEKVGHVRIHPDHAAGVGPRTSLPSDEYIGALPREHSSGAGALPGTVNEAGVAILPDERSGTHFSLPSHELIGALPREHSSGVGALPGTMNETGVAVLPDEKNLNASAPSATTTGSATPANNSHSLAPPLPATTLGLGAAHGATKLGPDDTLTAPGSTTTTTLSSAATSISPEQKHFASETTHAHERASSAASMTAIAHGREGKPLDRESSAKESKIAPSPLAESTVPEDKSVANSKETAAGAGAGAAAATTAVGVAAIGQKSTALGTSSKHTTSLTPGKEEEGVGHPSTHNTAGTSREPGTYPKPDNVTSTKAPATTGVAGSKIGQHGVKGPSEPVDGTGTAGEADALISHDNSAEHSNAPKPVKDKISDPHDKTYPSDREVADVPDNKTSADDNTKTTNSSAPGVEPTAEKLKTERPTTPTKRTEIGSTNTAEGNTEAVDNKHTATTAGTGVAATGGAGTTETGASSTTAPTHRSQASTDNPVSPTTSTGSGTSPKKKTGFMKKLKNKLAQI